MSGKHLSANTILAISVAAIFVISGCFFTGTHRAGETEDLSKPRTNAPVPGNINIVASP